MSDIEQAQLSEADKRARQLIAASNALQSSVANLIEVVNTVRGLNPGTDEILALSSVINMVSAAQALLIRVGQAGKLQVIQ